MRPVSPVKPVAGAPAAGDLPFEAQGFEALLASAREGGSPQDLAVEPVAEVNTPKPPDPLDALADFGRIENPGLRKLLAQQRNPDLPNDTRDAQTQPPQLTQPAA